MVDEEQQARSRLADLQRQLRRARIRAAEQMRQREAEEKARRLRAEMDERQGLEITLRLRQVAPAREAEVVELSRVINAKMCMLQEPAARGSDPKRGGRWYRMFKELDADGNDQLSYEEFLHFIRRSSTGVLPGLALGPRLLADGAIDAMWRAMDGDARGLISAGAQQLGLHKRFVCF